MITESHFQEANYEAMYLVHFGLMEFAQPAPNPMFTELQTAVTAFCRPPRDSKAKWTCPVCGKKRGRSWFWTQIVPFQAGTMKFVSLDFSETLPAFTPVCDDHPLRTWPDTYLQTQTQTQTSTQP